TPVESYRNQGRGGKGRMALKAREDDFLADLYVATTHGYLLVFTHTGKVYWLRVWDIPEAGWASRGKPITQLLTLPKDERVAAFLAVRSLEEADRFVFFVTRKGTVKKTELSQFSNPRSTGIYAINLEEGDELVDARLTDGRHVIFLASHNGMAILFRESDVRPMGRQAYGVRGMKLDEGGKKGKQDDYVVGVAAIAPDWETIKKEMKSFPALENVPDDVLKKALPDLILTVTELGYGKRTELADYRLQSRGGRGVINIKVAEVNGPVAAVARVPKDADAMIVTQQGKIIRVRTKQIRALSRGARGVRLLKVEAEDRVTACAAVLEGEEADAVVESAATTPVS
ncbi:MAG: DNA gyrase C-terminal beta-propeller domain-containing protein, partial [Candidatus Acidiferrales bacterium]